MDLDIKCHTTVLCAKRNSGKSQMCKYLLKDNDFDKIFVFSNTESTNHFYEKNNIVNKNCIYDSWDEEWGIQLLKALGKENSGKTKETAKHTLLILDDIMSSKNVHSSEILNKIFSNGRHVFLSILICSQYIYQTPSQSRANIDNLLIGQVNRQSLGLIADEFMSGDIERKDFFKLYNRACKNYGFLYINNNSIKDTEDLNSIYGILRVPEEFVT